MKQPSIKNQLILDASKVAIARLARFSSKAEGSIRQTFLVGTNRFCGIRFEAGLFCALWLFDRNCIEFKRGDQLIENVPFGANTDVAAPEVRKAA